MLFAAGLAARAQTDSPKAIDKRTNEMTIGGIRPGKDAVEKAKRQLGPRYAATESGTVNWTGCSSKLQLEWNASDIVQTITVKEARPAHSGTVNIADCPDLSIQSGRPQSSVVHVSHRWKTGRGLTVGELCVKPVQLYGNPDSRSPSTKDGQPLELLYYAFDWAGPDVPQVMQVVCTAEKDGQAGRVVQITLAASSL